MHCPSATIRTQVLLPLRFADGFGTTARVYTFDGLADGREHLALGLGERAAAVSADHDEAPLVRIHSECCTGDVFGSERCDCGPQLSEAVRRITQSGGFLLYLRQEGRGIGLYAKLDAYALQDAGLDTYEANLALGYRADGRNYTVAAQMLGALGLNRVALLSNNPDKGRSWKRSGSQSRSGCRPRCTSMRATPATWRRKPGEGRTRSSCRGPMGSGRPEPSCDSDEHRRSAGHLGRASRSACSTVIESVPAAAWAARRLAYSGASALSSGRCSQAGASQPPNHSAASAA